MSATYNNDAADFEQEDAPPAAAPSDVPEPAPKAKKQSPQKDVDKFWQSFTTKYPGKITSILPSDIYAKTKAKYAPKGLVRGQSAGKSYEQAVFECKNAVTKIATECTRINAKYRDPHFDIEFDLKRDRRDCLDCLQPTSNNDRHWPRSVKRVADIFEKPKFYEDDATASDIRQGFNGDCWLLSALCAISNKKHLIDSICVARDEKVGVYGFVFHRDGEWIQTIIDDKLYLIASDWWESTDEEKRTIGFVQRDDAEKHYQKLNQTGSKALYFAQCRSENETWLPLLEKAYAKAHGDYQAIDGGFTGEAIEDLTGGVTTELFTTDILDKDKFWTDEIMKVNDEFLFGCATGSFDKWQNSDVASQVGARGGIIRLHAYSIMDAVEKKGKRLVKVRNPWATDEWKGAWSDGSEQWTGEWLELLNHKFGNDGIFWISYEDLLQKYSNFDRTRLFGKEWQVVQQWTTVNVPWTADYNDTKFSLTLTKRSPVVIVLSQLDGRYFKGMTGQYFFELHFRLSKDGADDYIVRSHGNYSMRRSVSTDIELEPGKYSVLMRITAQRDDSRPTPDAVIKSNVKYRQNKLIQIGLAYDLAHAKGEVRETEEEKLERKKLDAKKKSQEKEKKRADLRKTKVKEFERKKREKAREKRQAKRKEEYQRKKAEKKKAADEANSTGAVKSGDAPVADGAGVAAGVEAEVDKQAAAGAEGANSGEQAIHLTSTSTPPAESGVKEEATTPGPAMKDASEPKDSTEPATPNSSIDTRADVNESNEGSEPQGPFKSTDPSSIDNKVNIQESTEPQEPIKSADTGTSNDLKAAFSSDTTISKTSALTENALKSIPSVTINGVPPPPSTTPAAPGSLAPGDAVSAAGGVDDDMYDSDASFVSSIDSVLDFPEEEDDDDDNENDNTGDAKDATTDDADDDQENAEFANDPWNAVCVVGLRVYSKDDGCAVKVVRPKEESGEETGLDLDDPAKGASLEVEVEDKAAESGAVPKESEVKVEVKTEL